MDDLKIVLLSCVRMSFNAVCSLSLWLGRYSEPSPGKTPHLKLTGAVMW